MRLTTSIDDKQVRQALEAYLHFMGDLRPVYAAIGQAYERQG